MKAFGITFAAASLILSTLTSDKPCKSRFKSKICAGNIVSLDHCRFIPIMEDMRRSMYTEMA